MRVEVLSDNEVTTFLSFLETCPARESLIIRLLLMSGLRCGEVAALNVESVYRNGHVHPAAYLPKTTTKGHIARYADMPDQVIKAVTKHIAFETVRGRCLSQADPLFTSSFTNNRLQVRDIRRIVAKVSIQAIGRHIWPHLLRHSFATRLMPHTNIRVIQTLLGHASIATTQIYTHPSSEDCKKAVNRAWQK